MKHYNLNFDLELQSWSSLERIQYEFCTSPWYGEHLTKVSQKSFNLLRSGHEKLMDRQIDTQH